MGRSSRLRMIGGPNGSGKSTLLKYLAELATTEHFPLGFVQNPDSLQREIESSKRLYLGTWGVRVTGEELSRFVRGHQLFPKIQSAMPTVDGEAMVFKKTKKLGYLIPVLCDFFRQHWISSGESFTFETVMSGADKLDILKRARKRRYRSYLYFVCTDDVSINEARILNRVAQGGHTVPGEKVVSRYRRSLGQLARAIEAVDRAFVFDNSETGPRMLATFEGGRVTKLYGARQPAWFLESAAPVLSKRG